jgi:hypothetical protein
LADFILSETIDEAFSHSLGRRRRYDVLPPSSTDVVNFASEGEAHSRAQHREPSNPDGRFYFAAELDTAGFD